MINKIFSPSSTSATLELLDKFSTKCKLVNGATDLIPELEKGGHSTVECLIDISRVSGINKISLDDTGRIHIGPGVTHNQCASSDIIRKYAFPLAQACYSVGSPQIRNRGTLAGNLVTASPANDTISPLIALNAKITIRSISGERTIPLRDFYIGVRKTTISPNELLVDISFDGLGAQFKGNFQKFALRKAQAISLVNSTIILEIDEKNLVHFASITLGAVAPTIIHAERAEQYLTGKILSPETIPLVSKLVMEAAKPIDDLRSSATYRQKIVGIQTERSLKNILLGETKTFPGKPINLWGKDVYSSPVLDQDVFHDENTPIVCNLNGKEVRFFNCHGKSLLRLIREDGLLTGTKEGCGEGECGACTVFLDGIAVMSCLVPATRAHLAEVVTIEGISQGEDIHPVQTAFVEKDAIQCGYCTPGFIMSAVKLLEENKMPSRDEIKHAITGNLCRCTGYYKIVEAIEMAANRNP
jgi:xanthine dehydrogenase iron-sulfur cluster and FAD-binding subunit A